MARQLTASDCTTQVTILQRTDTPNALGESAAPMWSAVYTDLWAQRMPLRARELVAAGQLQAPVDERYRIRFDPALAITSAMRLQHGSQVYDIVGEPIDIDDAHITLEINCTLGARDGR